MSFIGNVPAEAYSPVAKDTFSGNDSTTDFTLSIPATTNSVEVFVENVQQEPTTAYTISGTTLSFTAAPVTGTNNIYVIHRGPAVQQIVPPAGVALNPSDVTATGNLSVAGTTTLTDDLNVDSGTLFVDASADAVGIGTTSPAEKLSVVASNPFLELQGTSTSSGDTGIFLNANANHWILKADNFTGTNQFQIKQGDTSSSTAYLALDSSANLKFNSGYGSVATAYGCRAWVCFNGAASPPAVRGSGNVSSITDNGTGEMQVNFSSAMPDDDYATVVTCGEERSEGANAIRSPSLGINTTSQVEFDIKNVNNTGTDPDICGVAIFR